MSTITTINATDLITDSRAVINTNFSNLNTDKIETSYLDTDTTLAANSDVKIATQKAVKAYVDAGGNVNASETTKGIVEEATDAEVTAGTATGGTGAKLFITPTKLATRISALTNLFGSFSTTTAVTTDATEKTIVTGTIPANTLGTNKRIRARVMLNIDTNSNLDIRFKYGATSVITTTQALVGIYNIEFILLGHGATNSQRGYMYLDGFTNDSATNIKRLLVVEQTCSEDSTADKTCSVTIQSQGSVSNHYTYYMGEITT